jgi:uncharacterized protein involved in cysteine biosynthesis
MEKLDFERQNLRKFGLTLGTAFLIITLFIFLKHRHNVLPTLIISMVFFISALIVPDILKPIRTIWMGFASVLGWLNTRLILIVIFYLIFTPLGFVLKLWGFDLLDRNIEKDKESYWKRKEKRGPDFSDYERQF